MDETINVDFVEAKDAKETKAVSMTKLFTFADLTDQFLMFIGTICAFGSGLTQSLQIIVFGDVINAFNPQTAKSPQEVQDDINRVSLYFVWIAIAALFLGFGQIAFWAIPASRQGRRLKREYVKAILRQEIGWFDVNKPSELATKVADSTLMIQDGIGRKVGDGAQFFAMAVSGIAIGIAKGWQLGLSLFAFTPILAFTAYLMMKALGDAVHGGSEAYATAGGIAEETIGNIRTVHSFNGIGVAADKYTAALEETEKAGVKKGLAVGSGTGFMFLTVFCAYAFGMYYGAVLVTDDRDNNCTSDCYDGGRVLIVFFAVIMGAMALGQAGPSLEAVYKARAAAVEVFKTIERKSLIDSSDKSGELLSNPEGHISIENVTFRYPSRPEVVVARNFSLEVLPGQTVALVGPSGCGKSTTVALLERFYDPEQGVVKIDGKDVKCLNVQSLRSHIGLVSQEPALFQTTVGKNIGMGKIGASQSEIEEAARKANAYDFIMEMPQGFETEVGERGVQLSGGQKQRIAIARAIIKNPFILLLDEATSALDTESEHVVQESLDKLVRERARTTIIIAHRLSTVRNADKIAFLNEGRIVELGTHDELLKIPNGFYASQVEASTSKASSESSEMVQKQASDKNIEMAWDTSIEKEVESEADDQEGEEVPVPVKRLWGMSKPDIKYILIGSIGAAVNGATFPGMILSL